MIHDDSVSLLDRSDFVSPHTRANLATTLFVGQLVSLFPSRAFQPFLQQTDGLFTVLVLTAFFFDILSLAKIQSEAMATSKTQHNSRKCKTIRAE